jgi:4-amino-4-deoxy-L-arabinose transferase
LTIERKQLVILLAAAAVLFALLPGSRDLWNPNEPIYGQATREMIANDTWVTPSINGKVFAEKPVLYYWMARVFSLLPGGPDEGNLRLPSAFTALVSTWLLYLLALPYVGHRRSIWAGALFACTFAVFWGARPIQMDILVLGGTLAVLVPLSRVADHGMPPMKGWLLAGAAAGLGFMGKGPVAWVLPALVFCSYAVLTGRPRLFLNRWVWGAAAAAVVVILPWHLGIWLSDQGDILVEMYYRQNFTRFHNPWDHQSPWHYFIPYFFLDMAPWAFFVPLAFRLPGRDRNERRLDLMAWIYIIGIIAFFSLSQSKRSAYIMPVAPAAAYLASGVLIRLKDGDLPALRRRVAFVLFVAAGSIMTLGGIAVVLRVIPEHPEFATAGKVLAAVLTLGGLAVITATAVKGRGRYATVALASLCIAVFLTGVLVVAPAEDPQKSARVFSSQVNERMAEGGHLYSYRFWDWRSGYTFYTGRMITNLKSEDELREVWSQDREAFLIVEGKWVDEARELLGGAEPILVRDIGSRTAYLFDNTIQREER